MTQIMQYTDEDIEPCYMLPVEEQIHRRLDIQLDGTKERNLIKQAELVDLLKEAGIINPFGTQK